MLPGGEKHSQSQESSLQSKTFVLNEKRKIKNKVVLIRKWNYIYETKLDLKVEILGVFLEHTQHCLGATLSLGVAHNNVQRTRQC